jgi:outer membrane lipoprotein SlyB
MIWCLMMATLLVRRQTSLSIPPPDRALLIRPTRVMEIAGHLRIAADMLRIIRTITAAVATTIGAIAMSTAGGIMMSIGDGGRVPALATENETVVGSVIGTPAETVGASTIGASIRGGRRRASSGTEAVVQLAPHNCAPDDVDTQMVRIPRSLSSSQAASRGVIVWALVAGAFNLVLGFTLMSERGDDVRVRWSSSSGSWRMGRW